MGLCRGWHAKGGDRGFSEGHRPSKPADDQLWYFPTIAAAYADPAVGRPDDARKIVKTLLSRKPKYSTFKSVSRAFPYKTKELADRYVNAARSVGLPE